MAWDLWTGVGGWFQHWSMKEDRKRPKERESLEIILLFGIEKVHKLTRIKRMMHSWPPSELFTGLLGIISLLARSKLQVWPIWRGRINGARRPQRKFPEQKSVSYERRLDQTHTCVWSRRDCSFPLDKGGISGPPLEGATRRASTPFAYHWNSTKAVFITHSFVWTKGLTLATENGWTPVKNFFRVALSLLVTGEKKHYCQPLL